jgi:hypothetical protein
MLRRLDFLRVTIEGHCDERGTVGRSAHRAMER